MGIVEVLLEKGLITPDHLADAMALRKRDGMRLDRALIEAGCLPEEQLLEVMGEQLAMSVIDLTRVSIDVETLRSLPAKLVYRKNLVAIRRENGSLTVATSDPYDLYAFDELRLLTGLEIRPVLAPKDEILKVI